MKNTIKFRRYSEERDLERLFKVYSDYERQINLTATKPYNSIHQFAEEIKRNISYVYKELFIAYDEKNEYIGFVIAYDYSANDGTVKIVQYIDEDFRGTPFAGLIAIKFMSTLFKYYPIRKIYSEVYGYNTESLNCHNSMGFIREGLYVDDHYYNGKYWDTSVFSFKREDFIAKFKMMG